MRRHTTRYLQRPQSRTYELARSVLIYLDQCLEFESLSHFAVSSSTGTPSIPTISTAST